MSRVKRGVTSHAKHKKVYKAAKGFSRPPQEHHPRRQGRGREGRAIRLPRPQAQEAHLPRALDPAHQRRGASVRHDLQRLHQRPAKSGITVDRKVLSDLAITEPAAFQAIAEKAKAALAA